jgi:hypothetical protein
MYVCLHSKNRLESTEKQIYKNAAQKGGMEINNEGIGEHYTTH